MRKIMFFNMIAILFLILVGWVPTARTQSTLGSITGVVTDPSGGVVPGARVTLVNAGTGIKRQLVTGSDGVYNFRALPVGTYRVQTEMAGFATQERTGLQLYADESLTVNMKLQLAKGTQQVEVVSAPPVLHTHSGTLASVTPGTVLQQMPVLTFEHGDMGIYGDVLYSPGVVMVSNRNVGQNGDSSNSPEINGGRQLDTMDTMDGMTVMAYVNDVGGGPVQPSLDGIQEIHAVLADSPAEFWRSAAVTVVTKSGTNQFHGDLFEDYNGSALNSRSFFSKTVPFRVYNNFGGSIGGPIKKDKLFFFVDYEGSREAAQQSIVGNAPLSQWNTGDFSSVTHQLTNPYTGLPYPGNQIPSSGPGSINPVSLKLANALYPSPNYGPPGLLAGNYRALMTAQNGFTHFNNVDARADYYLTPKDTLFVRDSYRELPVNGFYGAFPATGPFTESRLGASGVLSETHILSPTLINEFRIGYTDMRLTYGSVATGLGILQNAGLQLPSTDTVTTSLHTVPSIKISGLSGIGNLGDSFSHSRDVEWSDNLSWSRGRHFLKFGVDNIYDQWLGFYQPNQAYGAYSFNGQFTGNAYADFLLGLPHSTQLVGLSPNFNLSGTWLAAYAQDQFQVNPRLTLNYGVRWEFQGPYSDANGKLFSFDPKNGKEVVPTQAGLSQISPFFPSNIPVETAAAAGFPSGSMLSSHYLNFYPRFGFAYRPFHSESTVLRGGWGIYGSNVYGTEAVDQTSNGGPFTGNETFINGMAKGAPLFSFPSPFLSTAGTVASQNAVGANVHMYVPYTEQWNLTLEQRLGSNMLLQVAYVGTHSANLMYPNNLDQPPPSTTPFSSSATLYPTYQAVIWYQNGGVEDYNALQISATKNYGQNLFLNTGFTWARDLTNVQDYGDFTGIAPQNNFCLSCDYGNSGLTRNLDYYANTTYALPVGHSQRFLSNSNRWLNGAIGGWKMAWVVNAMSGRFFSPYVCSGFDTANTNTSFCQRPDTIGNSSVSSPTLSNWFNINAYGVPGCPASDPVCNTSTPANVGRFGNTGPRMLTGPPFLNFNLALMKDFHVGENKVLQARVIASNVFNNPNFGIPDQYVTDGPGVAGTITHLAGAVGPYDVFAREIDFMLRFQF